MSYTVEVIYDKEHDCYLLPLPKELLKELDWSVGDTLVWSFNEEYVSLRKMSDNRKEPEGT